ncbi:Ig-like domain-containing protein [Telluria beijingensis]|uniref:Ig-like domain-containing protein n=1 Tax=Telluria beijingensis TaxID=3068633 RepID=UPI002795A963|nr:Ig-like domain-containing protein [Massilia sp. REN29]
MKNQHIKYGSLALLLAATLSACGGGGGSPGTPAGSGGTGNGGNGGTVTPPPVAATPTVGVSLVNAAGTASSSLSGASPLTVRALVLDANKQPVPNALVTFTTNADLALFTPGAGTALTDASGTASITMRVASLAAGGAGRVSANVTVAGTAVTSEANYSVNATALTFSALRLAPASINAYDSSVVSVDLLANGAKYAGQQVNVNFSSACVTAGKATMAATVATNNGTAQTVYRDQGCGSNDIITVTADGVTTPASAALAIAAPAPASVQFVEAVPSDKSIVIRGEGGINRTETATLRFRVFDTANRPLSNRAVDFRVVPEGVVELNKVKDNTDQNGEVITTVNSLDKPTTFRIQAVLPGTAAGTRPDISTTSDSIVVTTGLPVQRAFSISVTGANVDGWSHDSGTTTPAATVSVLLADQFGNPVADGTPIVFQTNIGAIGTSDSGGCVTVNGGCSVPYRTQEPRVALPNTPATPCNSGPNGTPDSTRRGVATICASTTDGSNTQAVKTTITFSDETLAYAYVNGSTTASNGDLGSTRAGDPKVFVVQLTDLNGNPLPVDSAVAVTGLVNASLVEISPAKVPSIFAGAGAGPQGSSHRITLSTTAATPCTAAANASFNVTVTTPRGDASSLPFRMSVTCP